MRGSAIKIIQQAAAELGLPVPTEGVASKDTTAIQFMSLLQSAGYELAYYFDWEFLNNIHSFTTEADEAKYDLPDDFGRMVNQTIWSSDSELSPVSGPISPQYWQQLSQGGLGAGPTKMFRIFNRQVWLFPTPPAGTVYSYEYQSNAWVESYTEEDTNTQTILNDNDEPEFDFFLMVKFLKVKMWQAKGLDTTALIGDMDRLYESLIGADKGAQKLSLALGLGSPLLGNHNVPEGSW